MGKLLFRVRAVDYLDDRYRRELMVWLQTLGVDPHGARRIAVYETAHGCEARINEYVRDIDDGHLVEHPTTGRALTRWRVIPLYARNWPRPPSEHDPRV